MWHEWKELETHTEVVRGKCNGRDGSGEENNIHLKDMI
jgi:hypothetical protein